MQARRLINVCSEYGLTELAHNICTTRATALLAQQRHIPALVWQMQTPDVHRITAIAETILRTCWTASPHDSVAMLDAVIGLGLNTFSNPHLVCLANIVRYSILCFSPYLIAMLT